MLSGTIPQHSRRFGGRLISSTPRGKSGSIIQKANFSSVANLAFGRTVGVIMSSDTYKSLIEDILVTMIQVALLSSE